MECVLGSHADNGYTRSRTDRIDTEAKDLTEAQSQGQRHAMLSPRRLLSTRKTFISLKSI